jgi:hypothetical protein
VIRKAVGEDVLLDKDGSPMPPPVGLVDTGRISADTAHSFLTTKGVAPWVAARFYMNRNYFLSDPDAYNVCAQVPVVRGRQGQAAGGLRFRRRRLRSSSPGFRAAYMRLGTTFPFWASKKTG